LQTVSDPICSRLPRAAERSYSSFYEDAIDSLTCRTCDPEGRLTARAPQWRA